MPEKQRGDQKIPRLIEKYVKAEEQEQDQWDFVSLAGYSPTEICQLLVTTPSTQAFLERAYNEILASNDGPVGRDSRSKSRSEILWRGRGNEATASLDYRAMIKRKSKDKQIVLSPDRANMMIITHQTRQYQLSTEVKDFELTEPYYATDGFRYDRKSGQFVAAVEATTNPTINPSYYKDKLKKVEKAVKTYPAALVPPNLSCDFIVPFDKKKYPPRNWNHHGYFGLTIPLNYSPETLDEVLAILCWEYKPNDQPALAELREDLATKFPKESLTPERRYLLVPQNI